MSQICTLSEKTQKKSQKLVDANMIQELTEKLFMVGSLSGDHTYQVEIKEDNFICQCQGYWKNTNRDCYHCEAVRRFLK